MCMHIPIVLCASLVLPVLHLRVNDLFSDSTLLED